MTTTGDTFTSAEVAARARITPRQVDHWTRQGYLQTIGDVGGSGNPRSYDFAQLSKAALMASLIALFGSNPARASQLADDAYGWIRVNGGDTDD